MDASIHGFSCSQDACPGRGQCLPTSSYIRILLGSYRDNGQENGNDYNNMIAVCWYSFVATTTLYCPAGQRISKERDQRKDRYTILWKGMVKC